jgi:hypothetical protein
LLYLRIGDFIKEVKGVLNKPIELNKKSEEEKEDASENTPKFNRSA